MPSEKAKASPAEIAAALSRPTISPMPFQKLGIVDLSLAGIYQACAEYLKDPKAGRGIECIRLGRKFMIRTAPWRRLYAMDAAPERREIPIEAGLNILGKLIATGPRGSETAFEAIDCTGASIGSFSTYEAAVGELVAKFLASESAKVGRSEPAS